MHDEESIKKYHCPTQMPEKIGYSIIIIPASRDLVCDCLSMLRLVRSGRMFAYEQTTHTNTRWAIGQIVGYTDEKVRIECGKGCLFLSRQCVMCAHWMDMSINIRGENGEMP